MTHITGYLEMDNAPLLLSCSQVQWARGPVPVTVVLITLNEAHNLRRVFENLKGWAHSVLVVDSYSQDSTVDICLEFGVQVIQRKFDGFGHQWNFAIQDKFISAPWTMKLDPDEIITDGLKLSIQNAIYKNKADALFVKRQLFFMSSSLPVIQSILRVWKTGTCRFTDVMVNEHPIVQGKPLLVEGVLEHHDSPSLHHWFHKQNFYTTAEANNQANEWSLAAPPRLFGSRLERISWVKRNFWKIPFRYHILFVYNYIILGSCKAGYPGYVWAKLRSFVYWQWELKYYENTRSRHDQLIPPSWAGHPDARVQQY